MGSSEKSRRVVIAITESSPLTELWDAALEAAHDTHAELVALFLHDERWFRAASLPFTREVSVVSGGASNFTRSRAEQLLADAAADMRTRIEQLADKAGVKIDFEVLSESDQSGAQALISDDTSVVVGPSVLAEHPLFVKLRRTELRIRLVESRGQETD